MYKKQTLFAVLAIQLCYYISQSQTIYVNAAQATNGDGVTWATAFNNLQSAIEVATPTNEIWVTQGTYYPSKDRFGVATPSDDRSKTFYINKNIKLFGGFLGTETALAQRNINNTTALSGDIGVVNDNVDNTYHVLYIDGSSSNGNIDNTCVLNGFTIKGGNANGIPAVRDSDGGGIFCDATGTNSICSPNIRNNIFKDNIALSDGGAIANYALFGGICSSKIINCYFLNNVAGVAGAIFNYSYYGNCSVIVGQCFFGGNKAGSGGAICNYSSKGINNPTIYNSTFIANSASNGGNGGAIYNSSSGEGIEIGTISPKVVNCVLTLNSAYSGGAISNMESGGTILSEVSNCTFTKNSIFSSGFGQSIFSYQSINTNLLLNNVIANCIFWNNPVIKTEVYNYKSTSNLTNCIYSDGTIDGTINPQTGNTFTSCIEADPKFVNANNVAGADGIYRTVDDGLNLQLGSPAINAGDNSLFPAGLATNTTLRAAKEMSPQALTTDITGTVTRILETTIDMGAYETSFNSPLPLNFLQFTVAYKNEEAILNWKTSNEINTYSFEIERSVDGKSFNKIGIEKAKNNTEIQNYQFTDASIANLEDKNIYYRLKQIDLDGSHVFSKTIALSLNNRNNITLSPNPVLNIANINIGKENDLINTKMTLFDLQSKQVQNYYIGKNIEYFDFSNLPKGMYFLKFNNNKTVKFLKD
jgi:hypothetical protein